MPVNKEILLVARPSRMNDGIFDVDDEMRSYESFRPFQLLREHLRDMGYDLKTIDRSVHPEDAFAVIFFEVPKNNNRYYRFCKKNNMHDRMYVYVVEPPATFPPNHDILKHNDFRGILTPNSDLVDNKKYFKVDHTIPIRQGERITVPKTTFESKKLLCAISSNKFSSYKGELYSERVKAIRFMEKNHIKEFDLYGTGWNKPIIHSRFASAIKLNGAIWKFWPDSVRFKIFPSYCGAIQDKMVVLPRYKFTIAYENCITPWGGWISEKLLEGMLYGSVPIYLGAADVEKRIPKGCFVDKRNFPSYDLLYDYISKMSSENHNIYLENIEKFLNSSMVYPFTIDAFIESFNKMLGI